ncbi:MAG: cation:proton antiporter [Solirubrobacteraceae bacterium]|nr:cation:proton antiporter [Solirubrobacteraceae bacterium]
MTTSLDLGLLAPVLGASVSTTGTDGALALIELGVAMLALGLMARIAHRLQMSAVPLYLLLGVVIGLGPGPVEVPEETIELGAAIGVVLLLFFIGLEYTGDELLGTLREHRASGAIDALLNAVPGFLIGLLMGLDLPACAALAGITWVSSSGIISRTLDDLGRLGNRETPSILSILVIEDLAMAIYLPILTVALAGAGIAVAAGSVLAAIAVVAAVLLFAVKGAHHANRIVDTERAEALLLSVLGLTLLVAGLAEKANVSAAVGAFLVGIALSGTVADRSRATLEPLRDLFAAGFFVFFGLQIDFDGLAAVMPWVLLLVAVGAAGKLATGWYAARRAGIAVPGRVRAGTILIARGEFSVVVASLAVAAGVDERLGPLAAGYVLAAALLGSVATRFAAPIAARLQARIPA